MEIIVVLIILGILSALSLSGIFSYIARSDSAQAFASMKPMKDNFLVCLRAHEGSEGSCFPSVNGSSNCSCMTPPNLGCACQGPSDDKFNYYYQNFVPNTVNGTATDFDNQAWLVSAQRISDNSRLFTWGSRGDPTLNCSGTLAFKGVC